MQPPGRPQPRLLAFPPNASLDIEGLLSSRHWAGHITWEIGPISSPILQMRKVRLREAKAKGLTSSRVFGCFVGEAGLEPGASGLCHWLGLGPETSKGQVITAYSLPSPRPCPLALSLTFNQVPVMSGPAVGAGPPQLPHDKWFSFEREVIKTHAQRHCQGTED